MKVARCSRSSTLLVEMSRHCTNNSFESLNVLLNLTKSAWDAYATYGQNLSDGGMRPIIGPRKLTERFHLLYQSFSVSLE